MIFSKKKILAAVLSLTTIGTMAASVPFAASADTATAASNPGVTYATQVQTYGWQGFVNDGALSGTVGKAKRLEAIKIKLTGAALPTGASISYETQVQTFGWQKAVSDGAVSGTVGQAKRLEAIKITLNGMPGYEVKYKTQVQTFGWQNWVTTLNGTDISSAALSGTVGQAKRLEAIEITVEKTAAEITAEANAESALETAETTKAENDVKAAAAAIDAVKVVSVKDALTKRLTAITTTTSGKTAAKIDLSIQNAISGITDTSAVIVSKPALIQAKVTDSNGKAVANATVVFTSLNDSFGPNYYGAFTNNIATTDSNGFATAVAQVYAKKSETVKPTDTAAIGALKYNVTVLGSNITATDVVKFAAISTGSVTIPAMHDTDTTNNLVPGVNAAGNGLASTTNLSSSTSEYAYSQQVSKIGGTEHSVTFSTKPQVVVPAGFDTKNTSNTYSQTVGYSTGVYFPYDSLSKSVDIPAGLLYATLNFNKIQISKETKVTIQTVDTATKKIVYGTYPISGPVDQSGFSYQIPLQTNVAETVIVTLNAPGQVQTTLNGGFDIKDVTGVYANTSGSAASASYDIPNASITWAKTDAVYSDVKYFATNKGNHVTDGYNTPAIDLATLLGANYNKAYTYSFRVPVFPYAGDAVITGFDANGNAAQYFVVPTKNTQLLFNGNLSNPAAYQNVNVIDDSYTAILTTKTEALSSVGSITSSGNTVTANSEVVGYTAVKGTINVTGDFADVFDATNNTVYTSVQWAPLPNSTAATTSTTEMAFVGQTITVKAQLTDVNGNPVSVFGQPVAWSYDVAGTQTAIPTNTLGVLGATNASVAKIDATTDVNGQATIQLNSANLAAIVKNLTATNSTYKVVLTIGSDKVTFATLKWVQVGLDFLPTLTTPANPQYGTTATVNGQSVQPDVGTNWEYGYKLYGTDVDGNQVEITISGMPVNFVKAAGSVGDFKAVDGKPGVFTATSNIAGVEQIIGDVAQPTGAITFNVKTIATGATASFTNVGTGTASIYSELILPITWKATGETASFITPAGTTIAGSNGNTVVYLKVTDNFGNPLKNTAVSYTIQGNGVKAATPATTDANGVVPVTVTNTAGNVVSQSVVNATVAGITGTVSTSINWVVPTSPAFGLVNIGYTASTNVVSLTFSEPVNPTSIESVGQFTVEDGGNTYALKSVAVDTTNPNVVNLTLADSVGKLPNATYDVLFKAYTETIGGKSGAAFNITDNYGRAVTYGDGSSSTATYLTLPTATTLSVAYDGINTLTITGTPNSTAVLVATNPALIAGLAPDASGIKAYTIGAGGTTTISLAGVGAITSGVAVYDNGLTAATFVNRTLNAGVAYSAQVTYVPAALTHGAVDVSAAATVVILDVYGNTVPGAATAGTFAVSVPAAAVANTDYTFNTTTGALTILAAGTHTAGNYVISYTNAANTAITGSVTVVVS